MGGPSHSVLFFQFQEPGVRVRGGIKQILQGKAGSVQIFKGQGKARDWGGKGRGQLGFQTLSIIIAPNSGQTAN